MGWTDVIKNNGLVPVAYLVQISYSKSGRLVQKFVQCLVDIGLGLAAITWEPEQLAQIFKDPQANPQAISIPLETTVGMYSYFLIAGQFSNAY